MDNERETDPRIVHILDQESEAFNREVDEFENTYGFRHTCTCSQDYTEGRVGEVTECFTKLSGDALDACAVMKKELDGYKRVALEMTALAEYALKLLEKTNVQLPREDQLH